MCNPKSLLRFPVLALISAALFLSGCIKPKSEQKTATLLQASDATRVDLYKQVNYLAQVDSMRAKMDLIFEDNSYAEFGSSDLYRSADGDIVVQRPASIRLKVEVPIIGTDVATMTSDGMNFRVAIHQDGGSGKNKKFILGSNGADYSILQKRVKQIVSKDPKKLQKTVNAFANLRPQHFTDALLVRPVDTQKYTYLVSTFVQEEVDFKKYKKKNPLGWVLRSFYLLDEFEKDSNGGMVIRRRFWFDRVGGALLSRQQIFGGDGEIESDIVYGKRGATTEEGSVYLPLEVQVTRPKEKYKMTLKYQAPSKVKIGKRFPPKAFLLENEWGLEVLDLDKKLTEVRNGAIDNANPIIDTSTQN